MLTLDLLRARRKGDQIVPIYLDPSDPQKLALAEKLAGLFQAHLGKKRSELDTALADLVGETTDYLVHRGLAKLLFDRSRFEVDSPVDPIELRAKVFALAGRITHTGLIEVPMGIKLREIIETIGGGIPEGR